MTTSNRRCSTCNKGIALSPTGKDIKKGFTETRAYCCDDRGAVGEGKNRTPQLASILRDDLNLCGPKAYWWVPIPVTETKV